MRNARHLVFLTLITAMAAAAPNPATGALDGIVLNSKGAPVAWAQIYWQTADGKTPHSLHAGPSGRFHLSSLPPGLYDLRAEGNGRWSEWERNVLIRPGEQASVALRLLKNPH